MMLLVGTAIGCGLTSPAASAEHVGERPHIDVDAATLDRDLVMIGGGMGLVPSFEGSADYIIVPVSAFRGHVIGLTIASRNNQLFVDLTHRQDKAGVAFHIGPVVNVNINRVLRYGDPRVQALGLRDVAIEAGGYAGVSIIDVLGRHDAMALGVSYLHDTSGVHDSYVIVPSADYGVRIGARSYLGLSASAAFAGDGYARTYFAVDRAGSLRTGLPEFANPRGGLKSLTMSAVINHSFGAALGQGFGAYGIVSYSRLQGDFAKSPIVSIAGSADQWFGGVGLGYTF